MKRKKVSKDKENNVSSTNEIKGNKESIGRINKQKIDRILNKKSDFKVYELIIFAVLITIASIFSTALIMHGTRYSNSTSILKSGKGNSYLNEFEEVYSLINNEYYEKVDKKKLIDGAINGMLSSLGDPHTSYFNTSETENFNELMNGSYEGIGAEISINNNGDIIVFSVFKNSPASEAGLKFNDIILEVNGTSVKGMTTTKVVSLIKDEKKPTAHIKVNRDGKEITFDVKKRIVVIESVESKIFKRNKKNIGYILINNFANNTYSQFKEQLEKMEKESISGLVIDVRGNSGGYLHSVSSMLDMFLPKGTVSYQIADKTKTTKYKSSTSESRNYPVAVLTNKGSASASEILAIGMKESYGADIVGTVTYGKGTVQVTKSLKGGSMIKYTIQKWLSPKGNWINEKGVEPTVSLELSSEYEKNPTEDNDNQLQKALEIISNK